MHLIKTQLGLWIAKLFVAGLICIAAAPNVTAAEFAESFSSATNAVVLEADAKAAGQPLVHFWSTCVGAGRANEGLRAGWLEQLKLVHDECGFQYVRFHGLFHSDMFVYHETANGSPVYNWQYIDDLFDRMLAIGVRPFVELGFNPIDKLPAAGDGSRTNAPGNSGNDRRRNWNGQFWWKGNALPPSDNGKWAGLVEAFVRHCIARYGTDEVRQWYFEVWNEPNLDAFFHGGTQQQYFDLYKTSALAIKRVDSKLRVGGPATSNFRVVLPAGQTNATVDHQPTPDDVEALDWRPVWVEDFIAYCHTNQLPLDFISTHPYPQDFPLDDLVTGRTVRMKRGVDATKHDLSLLRRIVNSSPYPQAEIQLTEWSSSPSSRDFTHDCLPAAAFVAKANIESAGLVDSLSYWTFTDVFEEKGAGDTIFHGGFGIVNYQGIVKPTFHAYRFLNALGDEIIARTNGVIITRKKSTGKLTALVYHYPSEVKNSLSPSSSLAAAEGMLAMGTPMPLNLTLRGLRAKATILVETLDKTHGNAVEAWQRLGSPEPPTRKQTAQLRQAAEATNKEVLQADKHGRFVFERQVEPWSLMLIQEQ